MPADVWIWAGSQVIESSTDQGGKGGSVPEAARRGGHSSWEYITCNIYNKDNYIPSVSPLCTNLPSLTIATSSSSDMADCFLVKEREHKKSPEMFGAENKKIVIKCGEAGN